MTTSGSNSTHSKIILSNEVQDIISYRPHWIVRKGNTILFLITLMLLAFTWFISYPDVVKGTVKLTAMNAPKLLVAKADGKLDALLVENEQEVKKGQLLAFLQSTANHKQVLDLQTLICKIESSILKDQFEILVNQDIPRFDQLGEIQTTFQDFQNILQETIQVMANGYYEKKKKALQSDLMYLTAIQSNTQSQHELLKQDLELQQQEYKANESLAKEKVIAPIELAQHRSKVIGKEQNLTQISAQLMNNHIAELNKKKEILELQKYSIDQRQKFRSSLYSLKSKVEQWIQQYIIIAPEAGKVLFTSFLHENQLLSYDQELFYLQPPQTTYYGQMLTSQIGLGKIKIGQRVFLKVQSYPSNEFGHLSGSVNFISNIPTANDSFLIKVDLPKGLETSFNKHIIFRNNLTADGEVITDNRKLFDRFLGRLRDIYSR